MTGEMTLTEGGTVALRDQLAAAGLHIVGANGTGGNGRGPLKFGGALQV